LDEYTEICNSIEEAAWTKEKAIEYLISIGMTPNEYKILYEVETTK